LELQSGKLFTQNGKIDESGNPKPLTGLCSGRTRQIYSAIELDRYTVLMCSGVMANERIIKKPEQDYSGLLPKPTTVTL